MLSRAGNARGRTRASAARHNNHWCGPLALAALPRDAEYGIFEVGMNHFGELRNLVSFVKPHVALITTIVAQRLLLLLLDKPDPGPGKAVQHLPTNFNEPPAAEQETTATTNPSAETPPEQQRAAERAEPGS